LKVLFGEIKPSGCKVSRLGRFTYIPQLDEAVLQEVNNRALMGRLGVDRLEVQTMSGGEETRLKIARAFFITHDKQFLRNEEIELLLKIQWWNWNDQKTCFSGNRRFRLFLMPDLLFYRAG
jgi:ABC-type hemin transport system ATPase subunit